MLQHALFTAIKADIPVLRRIQHLDLARIDQTDDTRQHEFDLSILISQKGGIRRIITVGITALARHCIHIVRIEAGTALRTKIDDAVFEVTDTADLQAFHILTRLLFLRGFFLHLFDIHLDQTSVLIDRRKHMIFWKRSSDGRL